MKSAIGDNGYHPKQRVMAETSGKLIKEVLNCTRCCTADESDSVTAKNTTAKNGISNNKNGDTLLDNNFICNIF